MNTGSTEKGLEVHITNYLVNKNRYEETTRRNISYQ